MFKSLPSPITKATQGLNRTGEMERDFTIIYTGRIHPVKDFDLLIDVIKQLRDHWPEGRNFKLKIYGEADPEDGVKQYDERVRQRVIEEGLGDIITFEGSYEQTDLPQIHHPADVLVLTSESETGPLVVMEAMMYATPAVATDVGSIRRWLLGSEGSPPAGVVIGRTSDRNRMIQDFVNAIMWIAANPELVEKMAVQGRKTALAEFSVSKVARAHLELFDRLRSASEGPLRLAVLGSPYLRDGVQIFYFNLIKESRKIRPEISVQLHCPGKPTKGEPDPAFVRLFDTFTIHPTNGENHAGNPSVRLINEIVCPALGIFLKAIKQIELGERFSRAAETPQPSRPEVKLLESAGNALVTLSDFFDQYKAYGEAMDSASVERVFKEVFPELAPIELASFREMLVHGFLGLSFLLARFNENADVIYFPQATHAVFPGIVGKMKSTNSHLVIGMHSNLFQQWFQHLQLGRDDVSTVPLMDITRSFSVDTRRVLQQYIGLVGHLVFHYADCVIHYTADTQRWIEQHYGVPPEKSVQLTTGIEDRASLRKLPGLIAGTDTASTQKRKHGLR
jgi:Glycosyl transferases group 1